MLKIKIMACTLEVMYSFSYVLKVWLLLFFFGGGGGGGGGGFAQSLVAVATFSIDS